MFRAALCMFTVQGSPSAENKDPPGNDPRFEAGRQGFDEAPKWLTRRILPGTSRHMSLAPGPEKLSARPLQTNVSSQVLSAVKQGG